MKPSPTDRANQVQGIERLGVYLSYMRKRPGMYFGEPPYLMPFHNFLLGYELAESCHGVADRHFDIDGFSKWLHSEKGLERNPNLGWPGMIEMFESDGLRQLELVIDYFADYAGIQLIEEESV
jgi:hypothetical protein